MVLISGDGSIAWLGYGCIMESGGPPIAFGPIVHALRPDNTKVQLQIISIGNAQEY